MASSTRSRGRRLRGKQDRGGDFELLESGRDVGFREKAEEVIAERGGHRNTEPTRGFVERITLSEQDFLEREEELFRAAPLREVVLTDAGRRMTAVAAVPRLLTVEALSLQNVGWGTHPEAGWLEALSTSPYLTRLTALGLAGLGVHGMDVEALTATPSSP